MYKKILAAVNEHVNSEISARYALHLAKAENARIYFCSIAENGISDKGFRVAEEAVRRLSARARELGLKSSCILETGRPIEQLKKIVSAEEIDIVFAATRREDVTRRFYASTTARRLSLTLPCSVAACPENKYVKEGMNNETSSTDWNVDNCNGFGWVAATLCPCLERRWTGCET